MEAAPIWELIENAAPDKKMYLDGIPNLNHSPVTKYLKDKNKTIISADDIKIGGATDPTKLSFCLSSNSLDYKTCILFLFPCSFLLFFRRSLNVTITT